MHYEVKYSRAIPLTKRLAQAYKDACFYNQKGVDLLEDYIYKCWVHNRSLTARKALLREVQVLASFAGIEGFPVRAIVHSAIKTRFTRHDV